MEQGFRWSRKRTFRHSDCDLGRELRITPIGLYHSRN